MLSPKIQKFPSNSYSRIFSKCMQYNAYSVQSLQFHTSPLHSPSTSLFHLQRFCITTTKQRQAEILQRQREMQLQEMMNAPSARGEPSLQAIYPGDLSDEEDEYIPEVDWDHTRFESHYKRIWAQEPEPETKREKIYNFFLKYFIVGTWMVCGGCFAFGCFAWYKMRRQLKYVRSTQRSIRFMRKIYEKNLTKLAALIPLDFKTMDVTQIKNELLPLCDVDETHISLDTLNEKCALWKELIAVELPLNEIIDYDADNSMDIEDVTYFIALLHYFLGQQRRKGTPSVRRQVRDDIYKMLQSYSEDGVVRLKNMASFACAAFSLAIISPPNLGDDKIGGQTLDEFKVNYCKYMLRDENMKIDDEINTRKFNFIYKICDFSIGLTPETRGQLSK